MNSKAWLAFTLVATGVVASEPTVPADFLGTWASVPADCTRVGGNALRITEHGIELQGVQGIINARPSPGNMTLEVIFKTPTGRAKAQYVWTFRLSTDAQKIFEIKGQQVVATRAKCLLPKA